MVEPLVILFEDAHVLAVAKPAGMATQGTPSPDNGPTLEALVRRHIAPEGPSTAYLGTVHRLDRPVSGVVAWAKTPKAARRLAAQFAAREARKEYWAVVEDRSPGLEPEGTWEDWLTLPDASGVVQAVAPHTQGARCAVTRYRRGRAATTPEGTAWLVLLPETGRTHQLRVQAARRGLAIVGDALYGASLVFPRGIALHARSLGLRHPILRDPLDVVAPLPDAWSERGIVLPGTTIPGTGLEMAEDAR